MRSRRIRIPLYTKSLNTRPFLGPLCLEPTDIELTLLHEFTDVEYGLLYRCENAHCRLCEDRYVMSDGFGDYRDRDGHSVFRYFEENKEAGNV